MNRREEIEELAKQVSVSAGAYYVPVVPERVARHLRVAIEYKPFSDDLSGVLVKKENTAAIGINEAHSKTRKRFSIGHELGHLVLEHQGQVFVDKQALYRRDVNSSIAVDVVEVEANQFAASLLMPRELVLVALNRMYSEDLRRGDLIQRMASLFEVSRAAMEYRLTNLGLIQPADD